MFGGRAPRGPATELKVPLDRRGRIGATYAAGDGIRIGKRKRRQVERKDTKKERRKTIKRGERGEL